PADVGAADADDRPGLQGPDGLIVAGPVVGLAPAVGAFAAGAVQPDAEQLPVAGQQLGELGHVVVVVGLAGAVAGVVPVPGGKVDPELQPGPAAGLRRFPHHVAAAPFPGGIFHAVAGVGAGPEAETVVVLAGQ